MCRSSLSGAVDDGRTHEMHAVVGISRAAGDHLTDVVANMGVTGMRAEQDCSAVKLWT